MTLAEGNLEESTATLDATQATLADTRQQLTRTSRSLTRTSQTATTLNHRMRACRYLVKVNDHLLYGSVAQQRATGELLKRHPNMRAVKHSINLTARHSHAVMALVKRAGYRNISVLVNACVPTRR
jgi:ABC-type transporter Mla subunit MlaD